MMRKIFFIAVLPLLSACSAYMSGYDFEPRPLEFAHVLPGAEDRAASVLVTVVGVRKRDAEQSIPASVELRIRVDNNSDMEARLEPADVQLFAANLAAFPPPVLPEGSPTVPPHGSSTIALYFPFPDDKVPGGYDLDGLSARWTLFVGDRPSTGNATFTRAYGDHGGYPVGFGLGIGFYDFYDDGYYHHGHCCGHGGGGGGFGHRPVVPGR